jgi:hypothetical protein
MANVDSVLSAEVVSSPSVYLGLYVIPDGGVDESAVGSPSILNDQNVEVYSVLADDQYGTPFIYTPLDQNVYVVTANTGPVMGDAVASYTQQAIISGIYDGAVGEPIAWVDEIPEIEPRGIPSIDDVSPITLIIDNQNIEPIGFLSEEVFGNAVVDRPLLVDQSITPDSIETEEEFGVHSAQVPQNVSPTSITTEEVIGQHTVFLDPSVVTVAVSEVLGVIGTAGVIVNPEIYFEFAADTAVIEVGGFASWTTRATVEGADWFVED